jgi:hypothetical protein
MRIVRKIFQTLGMTAVICVCLAWSQAGAAGLDGSKPIICAFTYATECDSVDGCLRADPEDLGLPPFFRVDFDNKKMVATGQIMEGMKTETQIKNYQRLDGQLFLQGVDLRGWSIVISESTGRMTLTASGDEEAFVLFGVCTVP